jgi:glycosyltransferase involved in cell wall biosynthesis
MKICLVTTFPPSQGGLSEYGLHIAQELRRNPFISLTILADKMSPPQPELEGFDVQRCWSFDDPSNALCLLLALGKSKPDVVWFNLLFSTFGRNPVNAFMGLLTPALARLSGCYTHVTLHHLMDTVNLKDAGIKHPRLYRVAGALATRLLLLSNSVSVLMPGYRSILSDKYGSENVHVRSHGVLTRRPEYPAFDRRGNPEHRILAFGKWGTYKRLELMIESFQKVIRELPNTKLVIAGGDHPQASGYVESMKKKCAGNPAIEFTGYVHEDKLPDLFQSSSIAVMPYSSSTGCSGVAHLACAYGVPILCADLPDFREMGEGEELAMEFYKPGDADDLAASLVNFLTNPDKQQAMALQNFSTALRMTMPTIVQKYLRHFELQQRTEDLRRVTRFRRLPNWVPSKALLLRMMTRNSARGVHRSAIHHLPSKGRKRLLDDDVNRGGKLNGSGASNNGHSVIAGSGYGGALDFAAGSSSARRAENSQAQDREQGESLSLTPAIRTAGENETNHSDWQQPGSLDWERVTPLRKTHAGNGHGGNGESGSGGPLPGSDGSGREGTLPTTGYAAAGERDGAVERS